MNIIELNIDQLRLDPGNFRAKIDQDTIAELANSILANGLIQPLVVIAEMFSEDELGQAYTEPQALYKVIAGNRRLLALRLLQEQKLQKSTLVPCILREELDERQEKSLGLVDNLQREDISPADEARGYAALAELGWKQKEIGDQVGKSQAHVSKRLGLLKLPERALMALTEKDSQGRPKLTVDQATAVAVLTKAELTKLFATGIPTESAMAYAVQQHTKAKARAKRVKELEAAGFTVVDEQPKPPAAWIRPGSRYGQKVHDEHHPDVETGQKIPKCLRIYVDTHGGAMSYCTDPDKLHKVQIHQHDEALKAELDKAAANGGIPAKIAADPELEAQRAADEKRKQDLDDNVALRKKFLGGVAKNIKTLDELRELIEVLALQYVELKEVAELLDVDSAANYRAKGKKEAVHFIGAALLAACERDVRWTEDEGQVYFDFLTTKGYNVTELDKLQHSYLADTIEEAEIVDDEDPAAVAPAAG